MSDITFNCPHCQYPLAVDEQGAGRKANCPQCGVVVTIPILIPRPAQIACPKCGVGNPEGASFCMKCGASLAPATKKHCRKCQAELLPNAQFCMKCGAPGKELQGSPPPPLNQSLSLKKREAQPPAVFPRTNATGAEPQVKLCPYCGEQILAAAKKCKHCGEFLNGTQRADVSASTPPKKTSTAGGCLSIVGTIILIMIFANTCSDEPSSKTATTSASTPTKTHIDPETRAWVDLHFTGVPTEADYEVFQITRDRDRVNRKIDSDFRK